MARGSAREVRWREMWTSLWRFLGNWMAQTARSAMGVLLRPRPPDAMLVNRRVESTRMMLASIIDVRRERIDILTRPQKRTLPTNCDIIPAQGLRCRRRNADNTEQDQLLTSKTRSCPKHCRSAARGDCSMVPCRKVDGFCGVDARPRLRRPGLSSGRFVLARREHAAQNTPEDSRAATMTVSPIPPFEVSCCD